MKSIILEYIFSISFKNRSNVTLFGDGGAFPLLNDELKKLKDIIIPRHTL